MANSSGKSSGTDFGAAFYSNTLSEVDREVLRLASICNVKLLDPGVLERVLGNDANASVAPAMRSLSRSFAMC